MVKMVLTGERVVTREQSHTYGNTMEESNLNVLLHLTLQLKLKEPLCTCIRV